MSMKRDATAHSAAETWTALLPGGRRRRLRVASGVRLGVGDVLWIGHDLYTVVRRMLEKRGHGFLVVVEPSHR
jgi:hypothetical protein